MPRIQLATDPTRHGSHSPRIQPTTDPTRRDPTRHRPGAIHVFMQAGPASSAGIRLTFRNPGSSQLHARVLPPRHACVSWNRTACRVSWNRTACCVSWNRRLDVRQLESNCMPRQLESKVGRASAGIEPHAASAGIEGWTCVSWNRRLDLLGAILPRPPVRHAALTLLPQPPTTGPCHHGSLLPRLSHHGSLPHVQLVASSHSLLSQPPITASYHGFHP